MWSYCLWILDYSYDRSTSNLYLILLEQSELEIINSEHEKNLLDDQWIMDDLFKYFKLKNKV